jgi:ADP-heptose:LPS heptosyltransferase
VRAVPARLIEGLREGGSGLTVVALRTGALGDILRTLPAVRWLRARAPACRIAWVADEPWVPLLDGHPDLDAVLALPRARWRRAPRTPRGVREVAGSMREIAARLRGLHADLALDFHGNLRSGVLGLVSGAPVRLGFEGHQQKEGNHWLTTHRVPAGPRRVSRVERNLTLVRALGLPEVPLPDGGIAIPPEASARAALALTEGGCASCSYAVISPSASRGQAYKKPPLPLLVEAARALERAGSVPWIVHGPGEIADAEALAREAGGAARVAPPTDLLTLAAMLRGARMFVGGDTGPLHLACAVGCPVVGIYGPTDPVVNSPWGVPHVVVAPPGRAYTGIKKLDRVAGGFTGLSADDVAKAIRSLESVARPPVTGP